MRTSVPLLLLWGSLLWAPLALAAAPVQRAEVAADAAALNARVVAWRRDFHQHPELSNREVRTGQKIAEALRAMGLEPKTGVAGHGVTAVIQGGLPGPKIALRADMDALPVAEQTGLPYASTATGEYRGEQVGVMHACGHDAHMAILLGTAQALVQRREQLPGQILLIFQPAEEGAPPPEQGGADLMLRQGLFADFKPEAVFGLHVFSNIAAGQIGVRSGPAMAASDRFSVTVNGRQTHGSAPWNGVDPIVAAADLVGTAQTIVSRRANLSKQPAVLTFGAIKGGIRYNIIPDSVEMVGTIRTFDADMRQQVFADLRNVADHVARAHGGTAVTEIHENDGNPATVNDPALTARMLPSLQAVVGSDNVFEPPLQMGSEDFSLYAQQVPSLFFFVGATGEGIDPATAPSNHSPKFLLDEKALDVGLRAMLQLSWDYLQGVSAP
ncbi:MAG: amidohydrolase [Stenotrophomonas sp.]